ncbi:MAG: outer membrane lipoprotein carrier protein LolA [Thermoanaerobaculum sp.]|nr:outer membrane lipoprotein carrier protein LolA [Thermoanaerobaculum sp.]
MLSVLVLLASVDPALDRVAAQLQQSKAWQAEFVQVFLPAGFAKGEEQRGILTFAHPARVRFEYTSKPRRVFATDGVLARMVDLEAGTCQAVKVDSQTWSSIPLASLSDPGALRQAFQVEERTPVITLIPRQASASITKVTVTVDAAYLPQELLVEDPSGNTNRFAFRRWRPLSQADPKLFSPAPPGQEPCRPRDDNPEFQR